MLIKTENEYMQENNRRMPEITDPLYFVIDEKLNSIDLTDKGNDTITAAGEDPRFFILPNIGDGRKSCSLKHKVAPQERFCNQYQPCLDTWTRGEKAVSYTHLDVYKRQA